MTSGNFSSALSLGSRVHFPLGSSSRSFRWQESCGFVEHSPSDPYKFFLLISYHGIFPPYLKMPLNICLKYKMSMSIFTIKFNVNLRFFHLLKKLFSSTFSNASEVVNYFLQTQLFISTTVHCHFQLYRQQIWGDVCIFPRASNNCSPEFFITTLKHKTESKHENLCSRKPRSVNFHLWAYTEWQLGRQEWEKKFNEPLTFQKKFSPRVTVTH